MNFTDPLLNDRNFSIPELEREQEAMQQKIAEMKRNYRQSAQTTSSPVWDEIDRIMDSLTEKEFRFMQENEEFQQSSMEIQSILNREYMRIMRPIVEGTKDGKDALDKHLTLTKRLKKTVKDEADKKEFLAELGVETSGLDRLIAASYKLLGLISYLTAGPQESRAWTITKGTKAPQAAGKIHSDFERGFIRAEVVHYDDLMRLGSYNAAKEQGLVRSEGKEYVMKDGDVVLFRFNV